MRLSAGEPLRQFYRGSRILIKIENALKIGCANCFCAYVGNMNWQQAVSLAIVASVAGLFLWGRLRRRKFSFERDTHCGCSASGQSETKGSIVFHARKGERPEVVVKMK
jgi:hypothetical protein